VDEGDFRQCKRAVLVSRVGRFQIHPLRRQARKLLGQDFACQGFHPHAIAAAWGGGGTYWSWTANDYHQKSGNLALADGSAQSATISGLHNYLANSTNSAAFEVLNFMP